MNAALNGRLWLAEEQCTLHDKQTMERLAETIDITTIQAAAPTAIQIQYSATAYYPDFPFILATFPMRTSMVCRYHSKVATDRDEGTVTLLPHS